MTNEQAEWLRAHPEYEIIGTQGMSKEGGELLRGSDRHTRMGALEPDGTFRGRTRPTGDAILVGVRKAPDPHPGGRMGFA
jgi:hypothetical protein